MKRLPIANLTSGMIVAEDVFNEKLQVIIPKNVILTDSIISRLESYGILSVAVKDSATERVAKPRETIQVPRNKNAVPNEAKLQSSKQFQIFYRDFTHCADHFRDTFLRSICYGEPFSSTEIVTETLNLMEQQGSTIDLFDMLLNMKNIDDSIYAHCIDVALICNVFSKWLHFSKEDQIIATTCGLFHDVGKFFIPNKILRKPGKLTDEEFNTLKLHTVEGYRLLRRFPQVPEAAKLAALRHHEKCDGSGYPQALHNDQIDRFTKMVTIADIFDAMTSQRVYRKSLCPFTVLHAFEEEGFQKYDMHYIMTFIENISNAYLNHDVILSNGQKGNIIFINQPMRDLPTIVTPDKKIINLQDLYYKNLSDSMKGQYLYIKNVL